MNKIGILLFVGSILVAVAGIIIAFVYDAPTGIITIAVAIISFFTAIIKVFGAKKTKDEKSTDSTQASNQAINLKDIDAENATIENDDNNSDNKSQSIEIEGGTYKGTTIRNSNKATSNTKKR